MSKMQSFVQCRLGFLSREKASVAEIRSTPVKRDRYKLLGLVCYFLRCSWLLGLPQVAVDGNGIYTGRHGLSWDFAKLLPVRVVLEQAVDHLARDALGPDAGQLVNLLCVGAGRVHSAELAARITEQDQEVVDQ